MAHRRLRTWGITAALILGAGVIAWAANTKLSSLSNASAISGTNRFYCVQSDGAGGLSCTATQIGTFLFGGVTNHGVALGTAGATLGATGAGTAGQVLTSNGASADPTFQAGGGGGGGNATSYVSGNWYTPYGPIALQSGVSQVANTIYCYYGATGSTAPTIKTLGAKVQTGSATSNVQFAVYSVGATTLTLIDSTGSISTVTSAVEVNGAVLNTTDALSANTLYAWCSNDSGNPIFNSYAGSWGNLAPAMVGSATQGNTDGVANFLGSSIAQTFNTWPGTITRASMADVTSRLIPVISFQVN
jgi:hypothetical protein